MGIVNRQKAIAKVKNIRHIKNSRIDNNNQHKELRLSTQKKSRSNYNDHQTWPRCRLIQVELIFLTGDNILGYEIFMRQM
jgi:hypothetical protein